MMSRYEAPDNKQLRASLEQVIEREHQSKVVRLGNHA